MGRLDWKTVVKLLVDATSQQNQYLVEKCTEYLQASLNLLNVCSVLEVAKVCSVQSLFQLCLVTCTEAAFVVLDSEDFDQVRTKMCEILQEIPDGSLALYVNWIIAFV